MEHEEETSVYGVTQRLIEARMDIDKKHVSDIQEAFDTLIEEARQSNDWTILSINDAGKRFNFDTKSAILYLMSKIFSHPNIITKSGAKTGNSIRRPLMYRYVSEEEKLSLGFEALYYKKIDEELLDYIYEQIDESYYPRANSILCVLSYLILFGADWGWVQLQTLRIATRSGMLIKDVIDTIKLLEEKHIICINYNAKSLRHTRRPVAVALAKNKNMYRHILAEANDPNIDLYVPNDNHDKDKDNDDEIERLKADVAKRIAKRIETDNQNIGIDILDKSAIIEDVQSKNVSSAYEKIIREFANEVAALKAEVIRLEAENKILSVKNNYQDGGMLYDNDTDQQG